MCVDVGLERSASANASEEVCGTGGGVATTRATEGAAAGAETVALEVSGTAADLG